MGKSGTSTKRKKSKTKYLTEYIPFSNPELMDPKGVADTLLECIREGDIQSFREVLVAHILTTNKMSLARKAGLGRRTIYDLMDPKKKFNPELSTIVSLFRALAA